MKDKLYLLRPGFLNNGQGPLYCNDSAPVEGMLSFCPTLRTLVDVEYLEFLKPRLALIQALDEQHQSLPVLILASDCTLTDKAPHPHTVNGKRLFDNERAIRDYLSAQYDVPRAS